MITIQIDVYNYAPRAIEGLHDVLWLKSGVTLMCSTVSFLVCRKCQASELFMLPGVTRGYRGGKHMLFLLPKKCMLYMTFHFGKFENHYFLWNHFTFFMIVEYILWGRANAIISA
ncbi:hypothetical protein ACJX0J_009874, partial [Zea mays]